MMMIVSFRLAIMLSVLLRLTDSDFPFGISKLFLNVLIDIWWYQCRIFAKETHTNIRYGNVYNALNYSPSYFVTYPDDGHFVTYLTIVIS
jgi:hypothetical protein